MPTPWNEGAAAPARADWAPSCHVTRWGIAPVDASFAESPRRAVGDCIRGRYRLLRPVGSGGWGVVYEATDRVLGRLVAVKVLHPGLETQRERFVREGRLAAAVTHRNVVAVYDVGETEDGEPFLVTELLEGEDLAARLARAPMAVREAVTTARQLLAALQALHEHGIVHRDIKPENVFLHRGDAGRAGAETTVKVLDFGVSTHAPGAAGPASKRLTATGAIVGTPQYMSPEQVRGEAVDERGDVYSVGAVLYEMLTGRPPHDHPSLGVLFAMILRDPITPLDEERPDCPAALGRVVHRALELLPGHRYDSARAMEEALAEVAAHFEGDDREACASYSGRSPVERWFDPSSHVASVGPRGDEPVAAHASGTWYEKLRDGWGPSAHRWLAGGTATAICVAAVLVLSMDRAPGLSMDRERAAAQAITTLRGPATATGRPGSQSSNASSSDVTVEPGRASDSAAASPRPSLEIPRIVPAASSVGSEELAARPHERNRAERDRASRDRVSRDPAPVPGAPLDTTELRNSAFRHYARGDLADAAVLYHRAVRTDPSDARAWRGLGLSVRGLGRDEDAKRALQRYLTLAPDARDARRVQAIVDTLEGR